MTTRFLFRPGSGGDVLQTAVIAALLLASLAAAAAQAQDRVVGEALRLPTQSTLNMQHCPDGKWEIGKDQWGPIVRVNMLKIEDADWKKVPGVKKAWRMKGFEGVAGMAFHPIISEVKDVDGDGKPDIFRLRSEHAGARIERLRYDDGSVVWESDPVGGLYGDETYNYFPPNQQTRKDNEHYKMHDGGTWRAHAMSGGHEGIHRQVDLDGNGRADVIMPFGEWHWGSDSILFLMEGTQEGLQKSRK